jgi:two-component system, NarL family, response regulator DesR
MVESSVRPVRVVVGRFEELVVRGLVQVLLESPELQIVGVGLDGTALERAVARSSPQVAVLDEGHVAQEATLTRLRRIRPEIVLLVLAHRPSRAYRMEMLAAGAACVSKEASAPYMLATIRRAANGGHPAGGRPLTSREIEVLDYLRKGTPTGQIACSLGIAPETVKRHTANLRGKLGVPSKYELIGMPSPGFPEDGSGGSLGAQRRTDSAISEASSRLSNQDLGRVIRRWRDTRGLTISCLAREAGVSSTHLSKIEHGRHGTSLDKLVAISRALRVPVSMLVSEAEAETEVQKDPKMQTK